MVVDCFSQNGALPNINKVLSAFQTAWYLSILPRQDSRYQQMQRSSHGLPKLLREADLCQLQDLYGISWLPAEGYQKIALIVDLRGEDSERRCEPKNQPKHETLQRHGPQAPLA
mmetsp:Transcript_35688/g.58422  ORF Transcript_35688/g.58422 Transcript_35688/m.58422 type:complete len:114 (+) Transcript_35688:82-423(+)